MQPKNIFNGIRILRAALGIVDTILKKGRIIGELNGYKVLFEQSNFVEYLEDLSYNNDE